ncbi:MAG: TraR/DksA C4-type zinc finger protein [Armatimonadetes bacterium]|nr:TraR/DksA C4-type zinc finger protein [Armatimonadota bacterium]
MPSKAVTRARRTRRGTARTARGNQSGNQKGRTKNARAARVVRVKAGTGRPMRVKPATMTRLSKGALVSAAKAKPLTKRELEEFRRMLEAERDRLSDELEAIEEHLPEVEQVAMDATGGYDEDLADVASDTFEREKGFAIENSVQDLLTQVEEALGRIEEGTYGICEICGQPIHPDRLRALPYARLCINCKAREEQATPR